MGAVERVEARMATEALGSMFDGFVAQLGPWSPRFPLLHRRTRSRGARSERAGRGSRPPTRREVVRDLQRRSQPRRRSYPPSHLQVTRARNTARRSTTAGRWKIPGVAEDRARAGYGRASCSAAHVSGGHDVSLVPRVEATRAIWSSDQNMLRSLIFRARWDGHDGCVSRMVALNGFPSRGSIPWPIAHSPFRRNPSASSSRVAVPPPSPPDSGPTSGPRTKSPRRITGTSEFRPNTPRSRRSVRRAETPSDPWSGGVCILRLYCPPTFLRATMRALVKEAPGPGMVLRDRPIPACGPSDVLIRVQHAGVCGTDLHIWEWDAWASARPQAPGDDRP